MYGVYLLWCVSRRFLQITRIFQVYGTGYRKISWKMPSDNQNLIWVIMGPSCGEISLSLNSSSMRFWLRRKFCTVHNLLSLFCLAGFPQHTLEAVVGNWLGGNVNNLVCCFNSIYLRSYGGRVIRLVTGIILTCANIFIKYSFQPVGGCGLVNTDIYW